MELRHLRYFLAIADLGSFTAASRSLHVSQSAISEQIQDLEEELGGSLLDRRGRGVRLTPQGLRFAEEARKTLAAADRAVDVTQRAFRGEAGTLSIGFFLWGSGGFFPRIIREYRRRRPGIRLSLLEMRAPEQMHALEEGRIDVGLTRPLEAPHNRILQSELLFRDPIVAVMRSDHPLAGGTVSLAHLAAEPLVLSDRRVSPLLYDDILAMFAAGGYKPRIANTSETWSGVLTLVQAGEGIALVPSGVRVFQARHLVFQKLVPNSLSLGLVVAWNPRNEGPALLDFLTLLRENKVRIQRSGGN
jgi:DNA-binding transcriptional LysR family regulator